MGFIRADSFGPLNRGGLLDAYRKQIRHAIKHGIPPAAVLFMWLDEPGVTRDDLIDALKEETGEKPRPAPDTRLRPGAVQRSPFT